MGFFNRKNIQPYLYPEGSNKSLIEKYPEFFRFLFYIGPPLVNILYLLWIPLLKIFPLPFHIFIRNKLMWGTYLGYLLILPGLFLWGNLKGTKNRRFPLPLLLVVPFLFCLPTIIFSPSFFWGPNIILKNSVTIENQSFHLVMTWIADKTSISTLYSCNKFNLGCKPIGKFLDYDYRTVLYPDEKRQAFYVVVDTQLFAYSLIGEEIWPVTQFWFDDHEPTERFPVRYTLIQREANFGSEFILMRCVDHADECTLLPFRYSTTQSSSAEIAGDNANYEFSVVIDKQVVYVYGEKPRCLVDECQLTGE